MACICALKFAWVLTQASRSLVASVIYSLLSWLSLEISSLLLLWPIQTFSPHDWLLILILPFHNILQKLILAIDPYSCIPKEKHTNFKNDNDFSLLLEKLPHRPMLCFFDVCQVEMQWGIHAPYFGVSVLFSYYHREASNIEWEGVTWEGIRQGPVQGAQKRAR